MSSDKLSAEKVISMLPRKWNSILQKKTGLSHFTVSKIVNQVDVAHPIWPDVLALLEEEMERREKAIQATEKAMRKYGKKTTRRAKRTNEDKA